MLDHEDWPKIIAEIEASGITTYKLSLMVHRQFGMIQRWKDGQEPKHHEGVMLLTIRDSLSTSVAGSLNPIREKPITPKLNSSLKPPGDTELPNP